MPADIFVDGFPTGILCANCYIIANRGTGECIIVDPGAQPLLIAQHCEGLKPAAVLLTHAHFDHFGAADDICRRYHVPLYLHRADIPALRDPERNVSAPFGSPMQAETAPLALEGGETLQLAGLDITVLHTPGHSPGGVCYRLPQNAGILTGDTLMAHGYGRTDFAGGNMEELMRSLRMLFRLTPCMTMYPGHDEAGTIGRNAEESP